MEKGMRHNIACCYLTHNHPEVVKEILNIIIDYYNENGIDIYIYDSSTNDDTKLYIENMINNGKNNLYYVSVNADLGGDGKLLRILKGYGLKKKYDYIWPSKDRSYVTMETAKKIQQESVYGYDSIFLDWWIPIASDKREYKKIYDNIEFFKEFGWLVTSWETMIISTKMLLEDIDWNLFEKNYELGNENNFNQILTVFGGLELKKEPKIRVLGYRDISVKNSDLCGSAWTNMTFELWGEKWPRAIKMLPTCYDLYKEKVIKEQGMQIGVFGSIDNLIQLHRNNILTNDVWTGIRDKWEELSDIPKRYVELILEKKYETAILITFDDFNRMLQYDNYEAAYYIITGTQYIINLIGNTYYWMLVSCFEVYLSEIRKQKHERIMFEVKNYKDLLYKYQELKFLLRRMEYGIKVNRDEVVSFIKEYNISSEFVEVVVIKETIERNKVFGLFESFRI